MTFVMDEENFLAHYGIARKSGRYPWGSGENPYQRSLGFFEAVDVLKKQGLSEKDIAEGLGFKTTKEFRDAKTIARNAKKAEEVSTAVRLRDKGMGTSAIGRQMGIPESTVRGLLKESESDKKDVLTSTVNMLRKEVDDKGVIDTSKGVETQIGIAKTKLDTAVAFLKEEGYEVFPVQVPQVGTSNKTTIRVLAKPGTQYRDVAANLDMIKPAQGWTEDGGRTSLGIKPPLSIDSKRLAIRYKEDGGTDADGVIYLRPGVDDISLGKARYAQVRIAVDGTHYLKGMAMYKNDLPPGVDLMFNTNKSRKDAPGKLDALKEMEKDPDNPFGSIVRQQLDPKTGKPTSALNIVGTKPGSGEEGHWDTWSRSLASQVLSKQKPDLAKTQLNVTYQQRKDELEEILSLTNPAVKRKMLEAYADSADSAAVHLKAAALPRSSWHVILPFNSLRENEIYAPNFRDGERVALIRYPHGGKFEIPELTVNNSHPPAVKALGRAKDAVGIHSKVAERLSGADFDGDTVLVIPNNRKHIETEPGLSQLKNFDPKREYPEYEGMKVMTAKQKQIEMGQVSNLITDMTLAGAPRGDLARAVKHSMVVIDAEKHKLNWKQSAKDNNIAQLKEKYQGKKNAGASTLISRATSEQRVRARKPNPRIDPNTGEKIWIETGEHWTDAKTGKTVYRMQKSTKLAETNDARTLMSGPDHEGTPMERIYADHSNRLKGLANDARKEMVSTKSIPYSSSARKVYAGEVKSLNAKLDTALRNAPRERQAQIIANHTIRQKQKANPNMDSAELKKVKSLALSEARDRVGAKKTLVDITDREWDAIQAGAVTNNKLKDILNNADIDRVKELATPKATKLMTSTKVARAKAYAQAGYTQAEIADALGVSLTTLKRGLE